MSDSLMPFQPAIEEPSNILPSTKKSSSTMRVGMVTCCSLPRVSVKRRSQYVISFSLISFTTSAGVMSVSLFIRDRVRSPSWCKDRAMRDARWSLY